MSSISKRDTFVRALNYELLAMSNDGFPSKIILRFFSEKELNFEWFRGDNSQNNHLIKEGIATKLSYFLRILHSVFT